MQLINRSDVLGLHAAPLSAMTELKHGLAADSNGGLAKRRPTNLMAARVYIFTVVTPDIELSIHFYRDLLGYELIQRGSLQGPLPKVEGVGTAGRDYALIRTASATLKDTGFIRLLKAPRAAKANRPRPEATIRDPGLSMYACMSRDVDETYATLVKAGVKVISQPQHYNFRNMKALPGAQLTPDFDMRSIFALGPAGEQMLIGTLTAFDHKPTWNEWTLPGMHSAMAVGTSFCLNRWPVWEFYDQVFGLKPTRDTFSGAQETINLAIGAPKGTYFQFGPMGEEFGMEWWEYRHQRPSAVPPWPTFLDRTGLAMTTVLVDDLKHVRERLQAAKIEPIGEGALPTPAGTSQDGLYLRGAVGELFEVVSRTA